MEIEKIIERAKSVREAKGLVSDYGDGHVMYHANQAQKAYYDRRHELKKIYPTQADLPAAERAEMDRLLEAMRSA